MSRARENGPRACVIIAVNGFGELPQFKQMMSKVDENYRANAELNSAFAL